MFCAIDSNQKIWVLNIIIKSNGKELPGIFQYYNDYHPLFFYSLSSRNIENLSINISKNLDDELSGIYIDEKFKGRSVIEFKIENLNDCNRKLKIISSINNKIKIYENKIK